MCFEIFSNIKPKTQKREHDVVEYLKPYDFLNELKCDKSYLSSIVDVLFSRQCVSPVSALWIAKLLPNTKNFQRHLCKVQTVMDCLTEINVIHRDHCPTYSTTCRGKVYEDYYRNEVNAYIKTTGSANVGVLMDHLVSLGLNSSEVDFSRIKTWVESIAAEHYAVEEKSIKDTPSVDDASNVPPTGYVDGLGYFKPPKGKKIDHLYKQKHGNISHFIKGVEVSEAELAHLVKVTRTIIEYLPATTDPVFYNEKTGLWTRPSFTLPIKEINISMEEALEIAALFTSNVSSRP